MRTSHNGAPGASRFLPGLALRPWFKQTASQGRELRNRDRSQTEPAKYRIGGKTMIERQLQLVVGKQAHRPPGALCQESPE